MKRRLRIRSRLSLVKPDLAQETENKQSKQDLKDHKAK